MKVEGRCHCGRIAYEAEVDPTAVRICHCLDCQTLTGSAFRVSIPAAPAGFRLVRGEPRNLHEARRQRSSRSRLLRRLWRACLSAADRQQPELCAPHRRSGPTGRTRPAKETDLGQAAAPLAYFDRRHSGNSGADLNESVRLADHPAAPALRCGDNVTAGTAVASNRASRTLGSGSSRGITVDAIVSLALGTAACIGYNSLTRFDPQAISCRIALLPQVRHVPSTHPAQQAASRTNGAARADL